ncbi:sodium:calcium symporter [Balneola sp. EhC07]|uniref:sodium-dependent transporter n=1 Tax=Balneola sp. EhC07 TaxID=1849360 RepID=UPI0007F34E00|nr:sodium-dependent transporter [Balneola sp. EhC07]OAN60607.1 sodium:calcium symporter [Balneola sp. EhC07]
MAGTSTSERGAWNSKLGFILAAAGSAVGLGNIWKFPFEVEAGGGAAFVLVYLIFCFILCFPVLITEIAIGRKTQKNAVGAFDSLGFSSWNFIGKLGILSGIIILSFYNVVAGWAFGFFVEMVTGNFQIGSQFSEFTVDIIKIGGYAILFLTTTAIIVSRGISAGIEKAAKILMPTLIIMIVGLLIYAFTLPYSGVGLKYYLIPEFSELNLQTIGGALRQAFFSLSLGMGALITYGSYLSKKENIVSSAALITLFDVGIAFIAGLMLFPIVAYSTGGDMTDVQGGAGLIFTVLPGVFESLGGTLGAIVGGGFFLLLSFAALTSTVSLLEVPVSYIVDEHKKSRKAAVIISAAVIFILGIPSLVGNGYSAFFTQFITYVGADAPTDVMTFLGHLADTFLLLGGLLIVSFTAFVWKKESLYEELSYGYVGFQTSKVKTFLNFAITILCPALLAILFVLVVLSNFFGISIIN